jgi:tetratricopeptide (TPR) repeat protein
VDELKQLRDKSPASTEFEQKRNAEPGSLTVRLTSDVLVKRKFRSRIRTPLLMSFIAAATIWVFNLYLNTHSTQLLWEPQPDSARAAPTSRFLRWGEVAQALSLLSGPRTAALERAAQLNRTASLKLGTDPRVWIHWARLGEWLSKPTGARPRGGTPHVVKLDELLEALELERLALASRPDLDRPTGSRKLVESLLEFSLRFLLDYPDDGRAWLLMGWALELDGYAAGARTCYSQALGMLSGINFRRWPRLIWVALARSLMMTGDLRNRWSTLYRQLGPSEEAWVALVDACATDEDSVHALRLFLDQFATDSELSVGACLAGALLNEKMHAWVWTKETYRHALMAFPTSLPIAQRALSYLLTTGEVEEARGLRERMSAQLGSSPLFDYVCEPDSLIPSSFPSGDLALPLEEREFAIRRLLDREDWGANSGRLGDWLAGIPADALEWKTCLDLRGRAVASPSVIARCDWILAQETLGGSAWMYATGAWSYPESIELFSKTLSAHSVNRPHTALFLRALWLSRQARHVEAIGALSDSLRAGGRDPKDTWDALPLLEILCRSAFSLRAQGKSRLHDIVLPEVGTRITVTSRYDIDLFSKILRALCRGDLDAAAAGIETLFPHLPDQTAMIVARAVACNSRTSADPTGVLRKLHASAKAQHLGSWLVRQLRHP